MHDPVDSLQKSIELERERLKKRPVPTTPWVMPLSLDELDEILDEIARLRKMKDEVVRIVREMLELNRA